QTTFLALRCVDGSHVTLAQDLRRLQNDVCFPGRPPSPGKEPAVSSEPVAPTARLAEPANSTLQELEQRVHARLQTQLDLAELPNLPDGERQARLRAVVEHLIEQDTPFLHRSVRERLVGSLLDDVLGLGPLERLLRDGGVSDILINGPREVFVERAG